MFTDVNETGLRILRHVHVVVRRIILTRFHRFLFELVCYLSPLSSPTIEMSQTKYANIKEIIYNVYIFGEISGSYSDEYEDRLYSGMLAV
jgi:hypothetical protein